MDETDASALLAEQQRRQNQHRVNRETRMKAEEEARKAKNAEGTVASVKSAVLALQAKLADRKRDLASAEATARNTQFEAMNARAAADDLVDPDLNEIPQQLATAAEDATQAQAEKQRAAKAIEIAEGNGGAGIVIEDGHRRE